MAENENLLPGDGDIGTEIQEGNLSRRNFLMAASFAGLGVFGGVRALGTLTGKMPIIADSKGVLLHEPERCVGCRRCELACTEFNDGSASAYLARVKVARNAELRPGRRRGQRLLHRPGHLRQRQGHRRDVQAVPAPGPVRRGVPGRRDQVRLPDRRPQDRHGGLHRLRHLHGRLPVGHAHAQQDHRQVEQVLPVRRQARVCSRLPDRRASTYVAWRDLRLATPLVQSGMMPASDDHQLLDMPQLTRTGSSSNVDQIGRR